MDNRINYLSFNHIQVIASSHKCNVEMFEFLRSKGISPTETDHRGSVHTRVSNCAIRYSHCPSWNIIHWLIEGGHEQHVKLLKHVLKTLPKDAIENMLMHQSKDAQNTVSFVAMSLR